MGILGIIGGIINTIGGVINTVINKPDNSSSSSSEGSNKPSKPSFPNTLWNIPEDQIKKGTVVFTDKDGKVHTLTNMPLYNGAFYDPTGTIILGDDHGPQGLFAEEKWEKTWHRDENGVMVGTFKPKKPNKGNSGGGGGGGGGGHKPIKPPFIPFDEPMPTFSSDLKDVDKYFYYMGIDLFSANSCKFDNESAFISPYIEIGSLKDNDYIQLEAEYLLNNSSAIEFYIIDGKKEVPILPYNQSYIENELIFPVLPYRFQIDFNAEILLKKEGSVIPSTQKEIETWYNSLHMQELPYKKHRYTISYKALGGQRYKPSMNKVQIKIIFRNYDFLGVLPCISKLALRCYTNDAPWIDKE